MTPTDLRLIAEYIEFHKDTFVLPGDLISRLQDAADSLGAARAEVEELRADKERLNAELRKLKQDEERLDWVDAYGWYRTEGLTTWILQTGKDETFRQALDAVINRKAGLAKEPK